MFSSRDVYGLGVVNLEFVLSGEITLLNRGRICLKLAALGSPGMEQDTGFTVTDDLVVLVRVKFNPELVLVSLSSQELDRADRAFFLLIGPVPKRYSLWLIITKSYKILVVN